MSINLEDVFSRISGFKNFDKLAKSLSDRLLGEKPISQSQTYRLRYAAEAIALSGKKCPALEPYYLQDGDLVVSYTKNCIKGRWPIGEQALLKEQNPLHLLEYANKVIEGPWPDAEETISKRHFLALEYALNLVKGRFPKGDPAILNCFKDMLSLEADYLSENHDGVKRLILFIKLLKAPWPDLEKLFHRVIWAGGFSNIQFYLQAYFQTLKKPVDCIEQYAKNMPVKWFLNNFTSFIPWWTRYLHEVYPPAVADQKEAEWWEKDK